MLCCEEGIPVVTGDELHALLEVLSLDGEEGIAGQGQHNTPKGHQVLLQKNTR